MMWMLSASNCRRCVRREGLGWLMLRRLGGGTAFSPTLGTNLGASSQPYRAKSRSGRSSSLLGQGLQGHGPARVGALAAACGTRFGHLEPGLVAEQRQKLRLEVLPSVKTSHR